MTDNPVSWWEIGSKDPEGTAEFLNEVFGWNLEVSPFGGVDYHSLHVDKNKSGFAGGGIYPVTGECEPYMTIFITVTDVDETAGKIVEYGGTIVEPPYDIEDFGRVCYFKEPSGQLLAIVTRIHR